jgi:hypothetical protein
MESLKHRFRQIKKLPDWIYWLPARFLQFIFHVFYRFELIDPKNYCGRDPHFYICVTWHNRLMFYPAVFPKRLRIRAKAVVSASRDGQYVADFIKQFGIESLRGSSSKRGAAAQLAAVEKLRKDKSIIIFTPDGPRGPRYKMKAGPIHLASITGAEVAPVTINYSSCWSMRSWDGFQIPKPFAKITLVIGDPIPIPPHLDAAGIEKYRQLLETELMKITIDPPSVRRKP